VGREHQEAAGQGMTLNPAAPERESRPATHWVRLFLSDYLVLVLVVLLFLGLVPFTPGLATTANLANILTSLLPLFVVAVGLTLVMITGGIDLSVTSIIAVTSVVGTRLMTTGGMETGTGIAAMLLLGTAIGAFNGAMIAFLRLPAFIITLASMMFLSGYAVWLTQSKNIFGLPATFLALGNRMPLALGATSLVAVGAHLLLRRTVYGRWIFAVGQNSTAAHISGVPVRATTLAVYAASGFCAALASIILTGRLETGSPVLGREILLDVIGATVVGGTSLFGGKGRIEWTFFGVLFFAVLDNALNLLNLSQFSITIAKGSVILLAAVLDALKTRFAQAAR
jgi:ribose transport system permease protein